MISSAQLSKELGFTTVKRVADIEEGRVQKPRLEELLAFAKYFNIEIDTLLYKKAKIIFE